VTDAAFPDARRGSACADPFDLAFRAVNTSINTLTIGSEGHTQPGCSCFWAASCQIRAR